MSNNKISGIHAIGVEVPEDMSLKELMEQLLEGGEAELEKELDEETRQPETGKCDCPVCDPDKDTVEERLFHPSMWPVTCMTLQGRSNSACSTLVRTSWRSRRR